ncbi:uncharacterized protein LOC121929306 [Sceloporus undulatus]|uniref:uncharacterized protein LOC121929306 n=1 Tax=Sceloporus undulatus TaxID=8520 RepID=UPI001C4B67F7|nr:uncharacterized protein LOC121929306 [Sceloporus undulatus]
MNTRKQTQKINSLNSNQRRLSIEMNKNTDMNELFLEKFDNLALTVKNLSKDLNKEFISFKKEIREDLKAINQTVDKLTIDVQKTKQRLEILEFRNEKLENDMSKILNKGEDELDARAMIDLKLKEKSVKIRGIPEQKDEDVNDKLIAAIANFMNRDPDSFGNEVDKLYRVNSLVAKQKGQPRDVSVHFVRKIVRDKYLNLHNESPFKYEDLELKVMKDIPGRLLQRRRSYIGLTQFLRAEGISYRWDIPEGLIFWWKRKRVYIHTPEQAKNFLRQVKKNHQVGKEGKDKPTSGDQTGEGLSKEEQEKGGEEEASQELLGSESELEFDDQDLSQEEERLSKEEQRQSGDN